MQTLWIIIGIYFFVSFVGSAIVQRIVDRRGDMSGWEPALWFCAWPVCIVWVIISRIWLWIAGEWWL